jgi:hypothetical protein
VESENKSGTSNTINRGNWNYLRMFQEMPEQYTGKSGYQGTKEEPYCALHACIGKC